MENIVFQPKPNKSVLLEDPELFDMNNLGPPKRPTEVIPNTISNDVYQFFDPKECWILLLNEFWDSSKRFVEVKYLTEAEQKSYRYDQEPKKKIKYNCWW